jgi:DNA (cytosine-5)-methyltransferase 1
MKSRRPPIVMLENVTGFLTSNDGNDFRDACLALNELGYLVDAFIVDASHFVPQSRQRLFLIGTRYRTQIDRVSEPLSFYQSQCRPAALADFILWNPEIRWSIRYLPPLPMRTKALGDIIETLPTYAAEWWSKDRAAYLLNQMSEKHRTTADAMMASRKITYGTVFRRVRQGQSMAELRVDGVAGCLRTPRGGSGRQILFMAGKGRYAVRLLTPNECARLMGADGYTITVSLNQALFGFGDAVCVPVICWIADNYLTPVWKELHGVETRKEQYATSAA